MAVRENVIFIYLFPYFCWLALADPLLIIFATLCTIVLLFYPADRGGTLLRNVGKHVRLHGVTPPKDSNICGNLKSHKFRLFPSLSFLGTVCSVKIWKLSFQLPHFTLGIFCSCFIGTLDWSCDS